MDIVNVLAKEIAKGIIATGVEGSYDSIAQSTAYSFPSIGVSQWEGTRADALLRLIPGGNDFIGRSYLNIQCAGELPQLREVLASTEGKQAQLDLLSEDCRRYILALRNITTLDDTRCMIYAGMWCPTSTYVVRAFLNNRWHRVNLRSLKAMYDIFRKEYYKTADVGEAYRAGYANRAKATYNYVAGLDLTTSYGIPAYGEAGNGK